MPQQENHSISRRTFLGTAGGIAGSIVLARAGSAKSGRPSSRNESLGIPGPYPGRVVEVHHPGCVVNGRAERKPVREMVAHGMRELTGAPDTVEAWRRFFAPGEVIGIKVNPVAAPLAASSHALVHEVVAGLESAGVKARDIVVFDRYRDHLRRGGYPENLPDGVRWDAASEAWDPLQLGMDGYDADVYCEIPLRSARFPPPTHESSLRSHVCLLVSRKVDKVINLPVLKDHEFAGVSLALKNMSHGFANNVARSHATSSTIACNTFIPAIVSLPVIRSKVVLHILDGTRGVFEGGPLAKPATVWNHETLYFATDPVALDRIGWEAVDAKRRSMGLLLVADAYARHQSDGPQTTEGRRQPQHVALASALGLGVFDPALQERKRIVLGEGTSNG